jgi:hypothetical protein
MKIYTQRLEDISPDQAFETVELTLIPVRNHVFERL